MNPFESFNKKTPMKIVEGSVRVGDVETAPVADKRTLDEEYMEEVRNQFIESREIFDRGTPLTNEDTETLKTNFAEFDSLLARLNVPKWNDLGSWKLIKTDLRGYLKEIGTLLGEDVAKYDFVPTPKREEEEEEEDLRKAA